MRYNSIKDPIRIYNELLGGKWRLLILHQLFLKTQRFRDLGQNIEGITPRMLTKELRILERYNLVEKEVYREVPPRVEYSLTDEGVKLYPLIETIIQFGVDFSYLLDMTESELVSLTEKNQNQKAKMEIDLTEAKAYMGHTEPAEFKAMKLVEEPREIQDSEPERIETIEERNARLLSQLATPKKKKIKISENTYAVQLELF